MRHGLTDQFGPVVAAQRRWGAADSDERFEVVGELRGGDRTVDQACDAFASVLVDDGADLDRQAAFVAVELEVDRSHQVRRRGGGRVGGGGTHAFAAATLRHAEALLAPQPLDLLVVHHPALCAGVVIRPAVSPSWVLLRVRPEPVA